MPEELRCHRCGRQLGQDPNNTIFRYESISPEPASQGGRLPICEECITANALPNCTVCGDVYDRASEGSTTELCSYCASRGYRRCSRCGVYRQTVDPTGVCGNCADQEDVDIDSGWKFWRAKGEDRENLYMGFELETDGYDHDYDKSRETEEALDETHVCECKGDGSLSSCGIELVAHPRTLKSHKEFDWKARFQIILDHDGRSYDADSSCGLHVHVNRDFMSADRWEAVDRFVNENSGLCQKFAQRRHSRWAKFDSDMDEDTRDEAKRGYYRYAAVNFCNERTIEFRLFKGTLNYPRFIATLEFVDALVRWAATTCDDLPGTWRNFCEYLSEHSDLYDECINYMKHRELWLLE